MSFMMSASIQYIMVSVIILSVLHSLHDNHRQWKEPFKCVF